MCSREFVAKRREMIRPWGSFVKTSNFEVPASPAKWTTRFYKNIEHFQSNYVSLEFRWDDWLALDSSICQLIFYRFSSFWFCSCTAWSPPPSFWWPWPPLGALAGMPDIATRTGNSFLEGRRCRWLSSMLPSASSLSHSLSLLEQVRF